MIVASPDGGVDIEEVAEKTPERIMKIPVDIIIGKLGGRLYSTTLYRVYAYFVVNTK